MKFTIKYFQSSIQLLLPVSLFLLLQSCSPSRELAYISDAQRDSAQSIIATYTSTIHSGDQLYIYVYSQTPESAIPFNQETHVFAAQINQLHYVDNTHRAVTVVPETVKQNRLNVSSGVSGYLVDEEGVITIPILGKIRAMGLTPDSLAHLVERRLIEGLYITDPVVTVSLMNFRVSVIGEVSTPKELRVRGSRLTLLEALAMCGDITVYGRRESVTVVRTKKGVATPITVDLTQKTLFDSEAYYLQPNDIIYVEPNKLKKRKAQTDGNWPKTVVAGVSLASAVVNIIRVNISRSRWL